MAIFISFNGTEFHNTDKIDTIKFEELQETKKSEDGLKYYLSFKIRINNNIVYESQDYKISEGRYDTPNGLNNYRDAINYCLSLIPTDK